MSLTSPILSGQAVMLILKFSHPEVIGTMNFKISQASLENILVQARFYRQALTKIKTPFFEFSKKGVVLFEKSILSNSLSYPLIESASPI